MKVKEMIKFLRTFGGNREVVIHDWSSQGSRFFSLNPTCTPKANSKNMVVMLGVGQIEHIPEKEKRF